MRVSTFSKLGITVGASALLATALVSPAYADPPAPGGDPTYGDLVGLGSDTTQDLLNGIANAIGDGKLASYDAIGSGTVITRNGGTAIPRASNSGGGRDMLRVSIGQTTTGSTPTPAGSVALNQANTFGFIDFARSSGGPGSADTRNDGEGVLTYVPFARDAVTIGVNPDSPLAAVNWVVGDSAADHIVATYPSLYNVYRGTVRYVYATGTAGNYTAVGVGAASGDAPVGSTAYPVQALLPAAGSGTRSFFIGKLGLTEGQITTINTTTPGTVKAVDVHGVSIQEHDGTALIDDTAGLVPFSIGQFVAQSNDVPGVADRLHGVKILPLNGTAPYTGPADAYVTNPSYSAMVRDVFNIVPSRLFDDPDSDIHAAFAGEDSLVCEQTEAIATYGFQLLPGTTADSTCGYGGLEAYDGSNSTVSLSIADTTVESGDEFTANVTTTSNYSQGGTVYIVNGTDPDPVGEAEIAVGATTAAVPVTIDDLGDAALTAEFVPTLPGVASSTSSATTVSVAGRPSAASLSGSSTGAVGGTYAVIAWIDDVDAAGGTVTFKDGTTTLGTTTLGAGEAGTYFTFKLTKTAYALTAVYAPPASSVVLGSTSAVKNMTFAKATPKITVPTPKSVKRTKAGKVAVTLTGLSGFAKPSGTVTIKEGVTTLVADKALSSKAAVTITLPKLTKGTHTLVVTYNGDATYGTISKTVKIKIT